MEMRVNNGYAIDDMVVIEKTGICIVQHEKYRKASAYYLFSFLHCAKVQIFYNPAIECVATPHFCGSLPGTFMRLCPAFCKSASPAGRCLALLCVASCD
ncbi:MAG: hypothetical protein GX938_10600 [Spirochaetales bacterium]|nr:hypothetical protein [Spirochaetales bacterium]